MLPEFSQFNRWSKALEAMWVLAFMGEPADMDFQYEQLSALNFWQKVGMPQPKPQPQPSNPLTLTFTPTFTLTPTRWTCPSSSAPTFSTC